MKIFIVIGVSLIAVMVTSCERYPRESVSPIIDTELPETAMVNEVVGFKVYHLVFNGCGKFSRAETARNGKEITVTFYGKYPEAICTTNIPTLETYYVFKPTEPGDYYFRFYNDYYNGEEYLLDTLRVQ